MARQVLTFDKAAPEDVDFYEGDFRLLLDEGETISTAAVSVDPSGAMTAGTPTIDGAAIRVQLSGGTAGTKYFVTFVATTSLGRTLNRATSVTIGTSKRPLT